MRNRIITILLLSLLFAVGCKTKTGQDVRQASATPTPEVSACCHEEVPSGPVSDLSIYNLESTWIDTSGQEIRLVDLRGDVVLVAMVYSSCKAACPRIVTDMKQIRAGLESIDGLRFVLVSMDPEVDTPERLKEYAVESKLDEHWELLHGDPEDVMELALLLGVKYRKTSETDYAHSNIISVLSRDGEVVHQQEGLGIDPEQTIGTIIRLLNE